MLITLCVAMFNVGRRAEAAHRVEEAVASATRLNDPHLLSQALGMREMLRVIGGGGLDEQSMRRAIALEDHHTPTPIIFRPSMQMVLFHAWTGRLELARDEIGAVRRRCGRAGSLTVSEQRVADLAASGMTNQDVAAALFISPKTVDANLASIYRKLGIHSRAELGGRVRAPER